MAKENETAAEAGKAAEAQTVITMTPEQLDAYFESKFKAAKEAEALKTITDEEAAKKAEAEKVRRQEEWLDEYVQVKLFKDGKDYKDDVFVAVNGEGCLIKRGIPVKIKRKFALVLDQSDFQRIAAAEYSEKQASDYVDAAKRYGI